MPNSTNTPSLEKKCILMKSIFPEAFMTYSEIEEKIRKVPEEYLAIIDAFIDGLMIQHQMKKRPSDELTAAIKESEAMLNDPNTQKFDSVDALFADLDAEE